MKTARIGEKEGAVQGGKDNMRKALLSIAAVLVLTLPASSSAATIAIKITATGFAPKIVSINQGDIVKWSNGDKVNHQLVANNGAFASPIMRPGDTYSFTFNAAGTFHYHDALRPSLTGTIAVKGPPPSIALAVSAPIVFYGDPAVISGTVSSAKPNESVILLAQPFGSSAQQVATLVTGAGGAFTFTTTPTILTIYSAKWKSAASQPATVQVRPKLTLAKTSATRLFAKMTGSGSFAGRSIYVQRRSSFGQWVTVLKLKLGPLSGRIFKAPHKKGTFTYRVYMTTNQAGSGYLDTWSNSVRVRYRR
jgi:plastocyanin